jgi:hypothetical protein
VGAVPDRPEAVVTAAKRFTDRLGGATPLIREGLLALLERVCVREDALVLAIRASALADSRSNQSNQTPIELRVAANLTGDRLSSRMVLPAVTGPGPDPALTKALARGHVWFDALTTGQAQTVTEIAQREGVTGRDVSRLIKLAFLSPSLVEKILAERRPSTLSTQRLTVDTDLPLLWVEQEAALVAGRVTARAFVLRRSGASSQSKA